MKPKLVRDLIPAIIETAGKKPVVRVADREETVRLLKEKLLEEAKEVIATEDKQSLKEELADVLEVALSISEWEGIQWKEIEEKRIEKAKERGRFTKSLVLDDIL